MSGRGTGNEAGGRRRTAGSVAGDGFGAGPGVAFGGADGGVPGAGEQGGRVGAVLGFAGEHGVPELVKVQPCTPASSAAVGVRVGQWPGGELEQLGEGGHHGEELAGP